MTNNIPFPEILQAWYDSADGLEVTQVKGETLLQFANKIIELNEKNSSVDNGENWRDLHRLPDFLDMELPETSGRICIEVKSETGQALSLYVTKDNFPTPSNRNGIVSWRPEQD